VSPVLSTHDSTTTCILRSGFSDVVVGGVAHGALWFCQYVLRTPASLAASTTATFACSGWQEVQAWLTQGPAHFVESHAASYGSGADLLAGLLRQAPIGQVCRGRTAAPQCIGAPSAGGVLPDAPPQPYGATASVGSFHLCLRCAGARLPYGSDRHALRGRPGRHSHAGGAASDRDVQGNNPAHHAEPAGCCVNPAAVEALLAELRSLPLFKVPLCHNDESRACTSRVIVRQNGMSP